jgi:hypothetical protein
MLCVDTTNAYTCTSLPNPEISLTIIAGWDEFITHERAIQAEDTKRREQRLRDFISTLTQQNRTLNRLLEEESVRYEDLEARCTKEETINRSLYSQIISLTSQLEETRALLTKEESLRKDTDLQCKNVDDALSKAEEGRLEAERECTAVKQAAILAQKAHTQELEKLKSERERDEGELRKELSEVTKQKDQIRDLFKAISTFTDQYNIRSAVDGSS